MLKRQKKTIKTTDENGKLITAYTFLYVLNTIYNKSANFHYRAIKYEQIIPIILLTEQP